MAQLIFKKAFFRFFVVGLLICLCTGTTSAFSYSESKLTADDPIQGAEFGRSVAIDGNIVVIGGVLRRNDTQGTTATPGLWKVPILGRLFRIDNQRTQRTELLIFISPKIVEASSPPARG